MRDDVDVLSTEEFATVRDAIRSSGRPSSGDDLLGMEIDFFAFLSREESDSRGAAWRDTTVHRVEGGDWLIEATARGDSRASAEVAALLGAIWEEHLRYGYRDAHVVSVEAGAVVLEAITQIGPGGLWVTARVRVTLE